jgi:hypothetical protein
VNEQRHEKALNSLRKEHIRNRKAIRHPAGVAARWILHLGEALFRKQFSSRSSSLCMSQPPDALIREKPGLKELVRAFNIKLSSWLGRCPFSLIYWCASNGVPVAA